MLDELSTEIDEELGELDLIIRKWIESHDELLQGAAINYNRDCLQPLISHLTQPSYGCMNLSLSDPLTMLLLVNCVTHYEFSAILAYFNERDAKDDSTPRVATNGHNNATELQSLVAKLVTVMAHVQKLYNQPVVIK